MNVKSRKLIREHPADYEVILEVRDPTARASKKRSHIYTFNGSLGVDSLAEQISVALKEADLAVSSYRRKNGKRLSLQQRVPAMQYHLQQAVISNNPIDYYYKEVFGDK